MTKEEQYERDYKKIVVTYHDGVKKTFTPLQWSIFDERVTKVARSIKFVKRGQSIWSRFISFIKSIFNK